VSLQSPFGPAFFFFDGIGEFFGIAHQVFLLCLVEVFPRHRRGFDVKN